MFLYADYCDLRLWNLYRKMLISNTPQCASNATESTLRNVVFRSGLYFFPYRIAKTKHWKEKIEFNGQPANKVTVEVYYNHFSVCLALANLSLFATINVQRISKATCASKHAHIYKKGLRTVKIFESLLVSVFFFPKFVNISQKDKLYRNHILLNVLELPPRRCKFPQLL
jgi:hypothetical protein